MDDFATIITDASFNQYDKSAGWAAWITCGGERLKKYGEFKSQIESPFEAEVYAIINGFYLALKMFPSATRYHFRRS